MNYLGTDPREGATLVASSDITSNTASVSLTGIFDPEVMYFIHVLDFRPNNNQRSLQYRWLDDSGAISITNYHEGGRYGFSGGGGSTGATYAANRSAYVNLIGGVGNASDEHGMLELWCVPNTANEKMAMMHGAFHTGGDEVYQSLPVVGSRLNTSATRATGIEFVVDSNSGGHQLANATIRVYKLGTKVNPLRSLKHRQTDNWVPSNYIGGAVKGQGWAKIAEITAADGDSALDFTNVFTSSYKRYVIVGTDCVPDTDNKNLIFQYRDASGLNSDVDYVSSFFSADSNGSTSSGHSDDQTVGLVLNNIGNTGNEVGHFTCFLDPITTNTPKIMMYRSIAQMADTTTRYITGNVNYNDATVMTGIKWYWSSNNWESGTIKIYGVND